MSWTMTWVVAVTVLAACGDGGGGGRCDCATGQTCNPQGECVAVSKKRAFLCDDAKVVGERAIEHLDGTPGAVVVVKPATGGGCVFDLVYRAPDGAERVLSARPSGYLTADGVVADGRGAVCASRVDHFLHERPARDPSFARVHIIEAVAVECAVLEAGTWSPAGTIVLPDGDWAAWVRAVEPAADGTDWLVTFARDSTFHPLNLTNQARPDGDGVYQVRFGLTAGAVVARAPAELIRDQVVSDAQQTSTGNWEPTADERTQLAPYIDFDDGACPPPGGCPMPPSP